MRRAPETSETAAPQAARWPSTPWLRIGLQTLPAALILSFAFLTLTGMKSCGGDPPPNSQQCEVAADCAGLPHIECVGEFSCEAGQCIYECGQSECSKDADCSDGQLCIEGQCEVPQTGCITDFDCPSGMMCDMPLYDATDGATDEAGSGACPPGANCTSPPLPMGQCVPKVDSCLSDADCGAGRSCAFPEIHPCPADAPCAMPVVYGICIDDPGCTTDAQCPTGYHCELPALMYCDAEEGCTVPGAKGECMPNQNDKCTSNAECGSAQYCDFVECNECNCPPDAECDCELSCWGVCRDKEPETGCQSDSDCSGSETCLMACPPCYCGPDDDCDCGPCTGECVVVEPPVGCQSDAECGSGMQCQMVCADCAAPEGDEDLPGGCGGCWGECVPKEPNGCESDAECGPNMACEVTCYECFYTPEGEPDPTCGGCFGQCVPVQPQGCESDADCGAGMGCQMVCADCDYGPEGEYEPGCGCWGECVPVDPPEQCQSDADCGPNAVCACTSDPNCPMCDVCFFQCLPVPQTECANDGDCADGEYCALPLDWGCDCPSGADCLCPPPIGTCEEKPQPTTECHPTGCSGEICSDQDVASVCIWSPYYICYGLSECGNFADDGGCGWKETPEYLDCLKQFSMP